MNINYQLNANELDINFVKSLKQLFKDREIVIHITDISDSNYLSKMPGMVESLNEGINEDLSECSTLEHLSF